MYPERRLTTRTITIKMIERIKSVFTALLSVPNTIGMGPTIIAPPPLAFCPSPLEDENNRKIATKKTKNPTNIKTKPDQASSEESTIELH